MLIVGGDEILDAALHRHGLPSVGAATAAPASTAILRLILEAAFEPMEPADLHALLCLDPGPVPRRVAGELAERAGELARELQITLVAAGHYATEVFGPSRVADELRRQFPALSVHFVPVATPL